MTKTMILPAEILSREFDARLLQGVMALEKDWQVILGSKALINRMIWRLPPSVYLCQTLTHKRKALLKLLPALGHISYGWDEEGLIYLNRETYLSRRVSSDTLKQLHALISWGEQSAADIAERAKSANLEPKPLGNPRFDLLRPELRNIYRREVENLHAIHGDYILINTNFGTQNPIISIDPNKPKKAARKDRGAADLPAKYAEFVEHRRIIFNGFKEMIRPLAQSFPELNIIVRPHPGEEISVWKEIAQATPNLKILREGASIPWQLGAKAIIHNGCTTAAESAFMGHTPIAYCPVSSVENESALPNAISHRTHNIAELITATRAAIDGKLQMTDEQRQFLQSYVSGISGPLCTKKIIELCEELHKKQNACKVPAAAKFLATATGAFRQLYKSVRINHQSDKYIPKVFPNTRPQEVTLRANLIAQTLGLPFEVKIKALHKNVFKMKKISPS